MSLLLHAVELYFALAFYSLFLVPRVNGRAANSSNPLHDSKITRDKDHIKRHLKDEVDLKEEDMSEDALNFHYFMLHDYDKNRKLDGLEILKAMSHYYESESEGMKDQTVDSMANMVDDVLREDDQNDDGYIDYPEYIKSIKTAKQGQQ